jgi:hypothetical protein
MNEVTMDHAEEPPEWAYAFEPPATIGARRRSRVTRQCVQLLRRNITGRHGADCGPARERRVPGTLFCEPYRRSPIGDSSR